MKGKRKIKYTKTKTETEKKKKKKQQTGHHKKKSKQKMKETAINKESEMGTEAGNQMLKQKQELMKKDMKNIKEPEKKKDTDSLSVFNCVSISCRPLSKTLCLETMRGRRTSSGERGSGGGGG